MPGWIPELICMPHHITGCSICKEKARMAKATLELKVRVAWWVKPYLKLVGMLAWISGRQPDTDKVAASVMKGVSVKGPK